jgi:hypothetical protein
MGAVIYGANTAGTLEENFKAVAQAKHTFTEEVEKDVLAVHVEKPNPNVNY